MARINASIIAPVAAFGATWAARKIMTFTYSKRTGHLPPAPENPEDSLRKAILWAVGTAIVGATIEVVVIRLANSYDYGLGRSQDTAELTDGLAQA
ncbi:MAG: DUF4235 domain-containing protein [Actinomycetes bacterium]